MTEWATIEEILALQRCEVRVRVQGTSMYPALFAGDYVTLRSFRTSETPQHGDIIFVRTQDRYYIHRFDKTKHQTLGDNNMGPDPRYDKAIGTVIFIEKTWASRMKRYKYKILKTCGNWADYLAAGLKRIFTR